jgi:hypothetical protein
LFSGHPQLSPHDDVYPADPAAQIQPVRRIMRFRFVSTVARAALAFALTLLTFDCFACAGRLHIEVQDGGVYALDYADIVAQQPGLADCRSDTLALLNRSNEVPIRIVGDSNGQFGPGSRIEWIGQPLHGPMSWYDQYSNVNVYQLGSAAGSHARMHQAAAGNGGTAAQLVRRIHAEQDNLLLRLNESEMKPGQEPDVWQWAKLTPVDAKPFTWNFDLADLDTRIAARSAATAALTVDFRGVSSVLAPREGKKAIDHALEIEVNGRALPPQYWDGRGDKRLDLAVPLSVLKDKNNVLSLRVPRRAVANDPANFIIDVVMFNWMEMKYPVRGDLAASTAAFTAEGDGNVEVELNYDGAVAPALYDADGGYRQLAPAGRGRYLGRVDGGTECFVLVNGQVQRPALVRPVAELDLLSDNTGYDYLMVAHPRLLAATEPLAKFHRARGLRTALLDVDAVYDAFNGGISHPVAIRNLVAWGSEHWQAKPRYLLLVGDASADIRHDVRSERLRSNAYALRPNPQRDELMLPTGLSAMPTTSYKEWDPELANRNLVPTWQFPSEEGQAASDNGFVALEADNFNPQLAVGRFPVVEPAEVKAIVDKTIAYITKPTPGDWRHDVTFISTDEVASFKKGSDKIAAGVGAQGFSIKNIYTKQDAADAVAAHAELKQDLDAGSLIVHFLGHGGAFIWRVGPPADLFTLEDVSRLTNVGRYPMVLAMTCFSAPFDNPTEDSIGERFLREQDKGAVAVFAASWTNSPDPQFSRVLIDELLKPNVPIGDAIVAAKTRVNNRTFVELYNLLGDPALVLARPRGNLQLERGTDRWQEQVIVKVPERNFGGDVDVDWVDDAGKTLSARHYEARDEQFTLAVPAGKPAAVRVYAANLRTGYTAIGNLQLTGPPKAPAPVVRKPLVPYLPPPKHGPAPAKTSLAPPLALPDTISRFGFDTAKPAPAPKAKSPGSGAKPKPKPNRH